MFVVHVRDRRGFAPLENISHSSRLSHELLSRQPDAIQKNRVVQRPLTGPVKNGILGV